MESGVVTQRAGHAAQMQRRPIRRTALLQVQGTEGGGAGSARDATPRALFGPRERIRANDARARARHALCGGRVRVERWKRLERTSSIEVLTVPVRAKMAETSRMKWSLTKQSVKLRTAKSHAQVDIPPQVAPGLGSSLSGWARLPRSTPLGSRKRPPK